MYPKDISFVPKVVNFYPLKSEKLSLIKQRRGQKYRMLFMLAVMSGARQGELLGLKWSDVDWQNRQIHIQRTFNNGKWYDTKTSTSNRNVDIGQTTSSELKQWKLACSPNDLDLIFPNESGEPIDHHNMMKRHFLPSLKAAKLPQIRFHDLRHTYASLLIHRGGNIKYIQSQRGYSSPMVTLNVYAHLMNQVNQDAVTRLENTIFISRELHLTGFAGAVPRT
jgi:integrase